jgi:low temperature requirement protein LtrA
MSSLHSEHSSTDDRHSKGRKLFGQPVLLQDWDEELEEGAFQYWELFLDLLLVAAASSVTDQFKENLTAVGFGEFVVFYLGILNGWLLYTHHITSRFQDNSLAHSMVLFFYCLGFGICIVNTGYSFVQGFCWGAVLQRVSVMVMFVSIYMAIPRARDMVTVLGGMTVCTTILLTTVALLGHDIEDSSVLMAIFWIALFVEFWGEAVFLQLVKGRRLVPINIDQTKERLGAMELVMLGESVLSVCMIYREWLSERQLGGEGQHEEETETIHQGYATFWGIQPYYFVLGYSFLLIYMFLLLYFHMQPNPGDHAFRRSRLHGTITFLLHKILGLAYLAVGTSVKLVVESVLREEKMDEAASLLMGYGVGASIIILFCMRYMHYGGRPHVNFGTKCMVYGVNRRLDTLASIWWTTVFIAGVLPIIGIATGWTLQFGPLQLTCIHALLVFVLVLLESFFSHSMQAGVDRIDAVAISGHGEREPLN